MAQFESTHAVSDSLSKTPADVAEHKSPLIHGLTHDDFAKALPGKKALGDDGDMLCIKPLPGFEVPGELKKSLKDSLEGGDVKKPLPEQPSGKGGESGGKDGSGKDGWGECKSPKQREGDDKFTDSVGGEKKRMTEKMQAE